MHCAWAVVQAAPVHVHAYVCTIAPTGVSALSRATKCSSRGISASVCICLRVGTYTCPSHSQLSVQARLATASVRISCTGSELVCTQ
eukprot:14959956-Alexandrium_andersonii.AAC.1